MPLLFLMLLATQGPDAQTIDTSRLMASSRGPVLEIQTGQLKGEPTRLSWSPDGQRLYLQAIERDKNGNTKAIRHLLITLEPQKINTIDGEPPWASEYWRWKSAQAPPGAPSQRIDVEHRNETVRATAAPMGGDLARGALSGGPTTGTSVADAANAALQSQILSIYTLRWHGEMLGEWTNTPVIPGLTFGWAPANRHALAFSNRDGRLVILDSRGAKQVVENTRDTLLPAWSDDGLRIAYLAKTDKKKYALHILDLDTR
jgi:hypothetical protein